MSDQAVCGICGEPMPAGEQMFKYHGYSGPCPKPPKPKTSERLVSGKEIWAQPEPTDLMAWAVCPYCRDYKDCDRCPAWEVDPSYGRVKRGCRMRAEEACRVVLTAKDQP